MILTNMYPLKKELDFLEYDMKFSEIPESFINKLNLLNMIGRHLYQNKIAITGPVVGKMTLIGDRAINAKGTSIIFIDGTKVSINWSIEGSKNIEISQDSFFIFEWGMKMAYNRIIYSHLRHKGLLQDNQYFWNPEDIVPISNGKYRIKWGYVIRTEINRYTLEPYVLLWRKTTLLGEGNLLLSLDSEKIHQNIQHWTEFDFEQLNDRFKSKMDKFIVSYEIFGDYGPKLQSYRFERILNERIDEPGSAGINEIISITQYHLEKNNRKIEIVDQPVVVLRSNMGKELRFACSDVEELVDLNKLNRETRGSASKEAAIYMRYGPEELATETYEFYDSNLTELCKQPLILEEQIAFPINCNNGRNIEVKQLLDVSKLISRVYEIPKGKVFIIYDSKNEKIVNEKKVNLILLNILNKTGWKHEQIKEFSLPDIQTSDLIEIITKERLTLNDQLLFFCKGVEDQFYNALKNQITNAMKIPTQLCYLQESDTEDYLEKKFELMLPQMVVKSGGIPFILETGKGVPESAVIGIDRYRDPKKINASVSAGVSVFSNTGQHLGSISTSFDAISDDKIPNFDKIIKGLVKPIIKQGNIKRLIILRDSGRGTRTKEFEEECEIINQITQKNNLEFIYILTNKTSNVRLFKTRDVEGYGARQVEPFTFAQMPEKSKFIVVHTQVQKNRDGDDLGTIRPVMYEVFRNETAYKLQDIISLLGYTFASLSIPVYESYAFTRLPAPLFYAHKLASFTSKTESRWELNDRLTFI